MMDGLLGARAREIEYQGWLLARGVRPVALLDDCWEHEQAEEVEAFLGSLDYGDYPAPVPFRVNHSQYVRFGLASHQWAADLFTWAYRHAPGPQKQQILGLLLGYSPEAVDKFCSVRAMGPHKHEVADEGPS